MTTNPLAPLQSVDASIVRTAMDLADEAVSANTRRTYDRAWRSWTVWAQAHDLAALCPEESGPERDRWVAGLILHLADRVESGVKPSTAAQAIHAIRWRAMRSNDLSTITALAHPQITLRLHGMARREADLPVRQADPLTLDLLSSLYEHAGDPSARDLRDRALIATATAAALRASSVAMLTLRDLRPAATIDGLVLHLRKSKTDHTGVGADIPIKRATDAGARTLDPVSKINAWTRFYRASGATPDSPLFPRVRGSNGITFEALRNPDEVITAMLRKRLIGIGLDKHEANRFSSHSFRATFVTLSAAAGVAEGDIAEVTRHRSLASVGIYRRVSAEKVAQAAYLGQR